MEHLIANSGIQFIVREVEFNPSQPLVLNNNRPLKYNFIDTTDFISGEEVFDIAISHPNGNVYIPYVELKNNDAFELKPNGLEDIDTSGLQSIAPNLSTALYTTYKDGDSEISTISSLTSLRIKDIDTKEIKPAFDYLIGKWLPMPFFEKGQGGQTIGLPIGWCRVKIEFIGTTKVENINRYRFTWAFDTELAKEALSELSPYFYEDEEDSKEYGLSNHVDEILNFMSFNQDGFTAFSDFVSAVLNQGLIVDNHKYIAYYIYVINFIRLIGAAPSVTLHSNLHEIPVDFVLDIGNSRTCGVLFEEGDFTKAVMLELRDLSKPYQTYDSSFDMRLVFRQADFGNDIVLEENLFAWPSLVRVGQEAKNLVYRSLEEEGLSEQVTNYSSPKRYLWDLEPYDGKWEFLRTIDDPFYIQTNENIYIPKLSDLFDSAGNYIPEGVKTESNTDGKTNYSRASLMTFVLIEVFNHAITQINSIKFRNKHGKIDCKRVLRSIILTCPTAMPIKEQLKLRQCAMDAYSALGRCIPMPNVNIIPSVEALKNNIDEYEDVSKKTWSFDEATCCQLVYLYAELAERYSGDTNKFFSLKGNLSKNKKDRELTIGSVDIGAGTTDVMVCKYTSKGNGLEKLTPQPLYWDSFYLAGDDILRKIIQNLIIEGEEYHRKDLGNISSALFARLSDMSDDQLLALPIVRRSNVYRQKVDDILRASDGELRSSLLDSLGSSMLRDFFGEDSSMQTYKDRRCRVDFNTQISHPMSQFYLELLRRKRPSKVYSFDEIFEANKPAQYLLDYFYNHFGFRFETLSWRFEPDSVAEIVKSTMEPLLKQLSNVFYAYKCDILILAGRPSSLEAITELFIKYVPVSPNHLIRLNDYHVGSWFPFADGRGYAYDQKAIVAVGGMIGYLASTIGFNGLVLDLSELIKKMQSTAKFIGDYNSKQQTVPVSLLSPNNGAMTKTLSVFPYFIGCKQFNSPYYQARPLYALFNNSGKKTITINISRSFTENREDLVIEEVMDDNGNNVAKESIILRQQSIVDDGKYWLDKGEFELFVK